MGAALQGDSGQVDALRTTRRDLPLLGAGCTPTAGPHRRVCVVAERAQRGEQQSPLPEGGVQERSLP